MSVQADIQNRIVGDPFGLVTGKVPFVLERHKKITLAELVRRAGISDRNLIDHGTPQKWPVMKHRLLSKTNIK